MAGNNAESRRQELSAEGAVCNLSGWVEALHLGSCVVRQSRAGLPRAALSVVGKACRCTPLSSTDGDACGHKSCKPDSRLPGPRCQLCSG